MSLEKLVSDAETALGRDGHSDAAALLRVADRSDHKLIHRVAVRGLLIARSHSLESSSVAACKALAAATHPSVGFPSGGSGRISGSDSRPFWRSRNKGTYL